MRRSARWLLVGVLPFAVVGCNPFGCTTDARSATYVGRLGESVAPSTIAVDDTGEIFLMLNEWRGSAAQQNIIASVELKGFVTGVSEVHVHAGTPNAPGQILWRSTGGYIVADTTWHDHNFFGGPAAWSTLWNSLNDGRAFLEVHSPSGGHAAGGLRQERIEGFSPACT